MRIWLHELTGNERGWSAWSLEHLGFATWAPEREDVLQRAPGKLAEYGRWRAEHGLEPEAMVGVGAGREVAVVEEIRGNEVAFDHDLYAAESSEIDLCLALIACTRQDLLAEVEGVDDGILDLDPPYRDFADWARWRTVRQILERIALTEVGYYLPSIGYSGPDPDSLRRLAWREQLELSRAETVSFLGRLAEEGDALRLSIGEEAWSVRKVLRRLVWHERLHLKSIRRILAELGSLG